MHLLPVLTRVSRNVSHWGADDSLPRVMVWTGTGTFVGDHHAFAADIARKYSIELPEEPQAS